LSKHQTPNTGFWHVGDGEPREAMAFIGIITVVGFMGTVSLTMIVKKFMLEIGVIAMLRQTRMTGKIPVAQEVLRR
jgi:hypothetical protein